MLKKKKHRVLWTTISKLVFDITMKAREEVRSKKKVDTNISVDWRATENVMALYNNYAGRFLQYISIAMANGPLAYGSESEDSIPQVDEVKSSNVTTTMAPKTNQDKALETLQILAHIPQMKLPPEYGNTFQIFLIISFLLAVAFPMFTRRAVRRARDGKMGLGDDGRKAATCSKEGSYMLTLNIVSNTFFFGVMITLVKAFACGYDPLLQQFTLLADPSIECFGLSSFVHYIYMLLAGIAIVFFYPLATMLIPTFQFMNKGLDIKFDASFITLEKQSDLFVAILATFYSELNTLFVLFVQTFICIVLAVYNYKVQPCLVSYMNPAKTAIYTISAYVTIGSIIWQLTKSIGLMIIIAIILFAAIFGWLLSKHGKSVITLIKQKLLKRKADKLKRENAMKILPIPEDEFQDIDDIKKGLQFKSGSTNTKIVPSPEKKKRQKNKGDKIYCPQCRTGVVPAQWISTFVIAECCVCFETKKMKISSVCGHGICNECYIKIKER